MITDPQSGIELLGGSIPYLDESEDELLEILREAGDRSSGSDELARHIVDWPTRYHLSPMRANLLRPLRLTPGQRVLDVGAGTGVLSRYLGESGLEVLALEGNIERARVAQARCRDLAGVRVVSGPLSSLMEQRFDLVVACGVLEYTSADAGGDEGEAAFLARCVSHLDDGGVLVLAIENQLGLRYLLGYPEDHEGRAFVGLEGYPGGTVSHSWSRRVLAQLLEAAGLPEQRWLYPYPDYKHPVVVLTDSFFDVDGATDLVDQVVRNPVQGSPFEPVMRADPRRVHRSFLDAGLGRDVANSFLVVAGTDPDAVDTVVDDDVLLWRFGDERRSVWLRTTTVRRGAQGWRASQHPTFPQAGRGEVGFLRQDLAEERPFYRGRTLEQQLLAASSAADEGAMVRVLERWRDELTRQEEPATDADPLHSFRLQDTQRVFPPSYLDINLDNWVDADGVLHFVDEEWRCPGPVDADLVMTRALWWLAHRLVTTGSEHPWSPTITVDELAVVLGHCCGVTIDNDGLERWRSAESEFQVLVGAAKREAVLDRLVMLGATDRVQLGLRGHQTEGALGRLERELRSLSVPESPTEAVDELRHEVESLRKLLDEMITQLATTTADRNELQVAHAELAVTLDRIRDRLPMRMYLRAKDVASSLSGQLRP